MVLIENDYQKGYIEIENHYQKGLSMLIVLSMFGCGDKSTDTSIHTDTAEDTVVVENDDTQYVFLNQDGQSSVSYGGQTYRNLLIHDLLRYIASLDEGVQTNVIASGQVETDLLFYLESIKDLDGAFPHGYVVDEIALMQTQYADVSTGKNLLEKLAGNDSVTDHQDWSTAFYGWGEADVTSPESLIRLWISQVDYQASNWSNTSSQTPSVYISRDGVDYKQMLHTFLLCGVAYSQGTDDYLDNDVVDKGLLSSHVPTEGSTYSALEHAWDEGFGYFGAAQDFILWTDTEIAGPSALDRNGDGQIDLKTEVNWNFSTLAAERDLDGLGTDFTADAWKAFWTGRDLLSRTVGSELSATDMDTLVELRDQAVIAWEKVLVATIVEALNNTVQQIDTSAPLEDLAHDWSTMKGFSLGLQFNPHTLLSTEQFVQIQDLIGQFPKTNGQYIDDLLAVRQVLVDVYDVNEGH